MNGNRSWDSLRDGEDKHDSHLLAPFEYIKSMPGKQIRTKLARAFNHWMGVEESQLTHIMDIIEMIHNASLMVDDIEDGSVLRRGLPVTHSVYGVPRTINTANYVYFLALERCMGAKMDHPQTVSVFTEHILELHRGQGKELYWRDTVTVPEEAEYEMMVLQKTGGLFMLTVKLMNLYHNNGMEQKNFTNVLNLLALFFQIRDDYLNLVCEDMAAQKTLAEDLTEGKFSFPIIHAIRAGGALHNDDPILTYMTGCTKVVQQFETPDAYILRQRTTSIEVKQYCIELIRQRGSFEHTLKRLREIGAEIRTETIQLGGNELLDEIVDMLSATIPGI